MKDAQIDDMLWRRAGELAGSGDGLVIEGFGTLRGARFEHRPTPRPPTGFDAPRLVVKVADELGINDDMVRSRLRAELTQALASAAGRPAPLGTLGLIEARDGRVTFTPARRHGAKIAEPDAIERVMAAWRMTTEPLEHRVAALVEALGTVDGALPPADVRRLLDEVDYELDDDGWARFGATIAAALPY